jgi:phage terminase large subunit GpA-like protein
MRWRGDFAAYQAAIQDALLEPGVEFCVVMGSSQWGKTACATNVVLYHVLHDPTACLVVEPSVDPMALDFSRTRLGPAIAASPALRERVGRASARDTDAVLMKRYRGGFIALAGGNSAASLAARSVQVVVLD